MARKPALLNVRQHLLHIQEVIEFAQERGMCPLVENEFKKILLINKFILLKHKAKRATGNRRDIYVGKK